MRIPLHIGEADLAERLVRTAGGTRALTPKEAELLRRLWEADGAVVSRERLMKEVWGYDPGIQTHTLGTTLCTLRRKIERDLEKPEHILTVRGEGFRFVRLSPRTSAGAGLPVAVDRCFGREALLQTLDEALGAGALVTLTGPGGVGKTRLALEHLARSRRLLLAWLNLSERTSTEDICYALGEVLGCPAALPAILGALQARSGGLLVFDNAESAREALRPVVLAVRVLPGVQVLVTSRQPLQLKGERLLPVPPLEPQAAKALFFDRVRALLGPQAQADQPEPLLQTLGGHPLAIELAAARMGTFTPEQLRARLDPALQVLGEPLQDGLVRRGGLRRVLEETVALLPSDVAAAFDQLSLLPGAFTLEEAEAVLGGTTAALDVLLAHGLLLRQAGPRPFRMLEPLRTYAADRLNNSPQADAARRRLCQWMARPEPATPEESEALLHACESAIALQEAELAAKLVDRWARLLNEQTRYPRLGELPGQVAQMKGISPDSADLMWFYQATTYSHASAFPRAAALFEALLAQPLAPALQGRVLNNYADLLAQQQKIAQALDTNQRAREAFDALGDQRSVGLTLMNRGHYAIHLGQIELARQETTQAIGLLSAAGDRVHAAMATHNLAHILLQQGAVGEARTLGLKALELYQERGVIRAQINVLLLLAELAAREGALQDARSDIDLARELAQDLSHPREQALVEMAAAELARMSGQPGQALAYLDKAALYLPAAEVAHQARLEQQRAWAWHEQGAPTLADAALQRAQQLHPEHPGLAALAAALKRTPST